MPRVLYLARTCPPLEPPFPLPPPTNNKIPRETEQIPATATQQHVDLDESPLPPHPSRNEWDYSPTSPLPLHPSPHEWDYDPTSPLPPHPSRNEWDYSPTSPLPPHPSRHEWDYDYESYTDEDWENAETFPEGYMCGDECFNPYWENEPSYADIALEHYNSQDNHEIKYQLVKAIVSHIIRYDGSYYHLNFVAKSTLENSKEEFFFAELRLDIDIKAWVLVSMVALEEKERIGGFDHLIGQGGVDPRHCFGCGDVMKHPVDGSLYEAGHYLVENAFFHKYIEVLPATQPGDAQD
ncbi:unnamed protein product [Alopecurus aequalis]